MIPFGSSFKELVTTREDCYTNVYINPDVIAGGGGLGCFGFGAMSAVQGFPNSNMFKYVLLGLPYNPAQGIVRGLVLQQWNPDNTGDFRISYTNIPYSNFCTANAWDGVMVTLAQSKPQLFGVQTAQQVTPALVFERLQALYGNYPYFVIINGINVNPSMSAQQISNISAVDWSGDFAMVHTTNTGTINPSCTFSMDMYPDLDEYTTDTQGAAWALFDPTDPRKDKLRFDVYLNGADSPTITVKWDKDQDTPLKISTQTVSPIVWTYPDRNDYTSPDYPGEPIHTVDGINVVDESFPEVRRNAYTWNGKYENQYLTIFNNATNNLANLTKVVRYGLDGIADQINLYLRFNYSVYEQNQGKTTWGSLFKVPVLKETGTTAPTPVVVLQSDNDARFITTVYVHLGQPPGDNDNDNDDYDDGNGGGGGGGGGGGSVDPKKTVPDFSDGESIGYDGRAVLTKTYSMTASVLQNIGTKLWTQSYYDVLKIQDNPIENIVSCKWFPFSLTGATESVKVGNVDFEINGSRVNSIYTFDVGSVSYPFDDPNHQYSYLDCSPYVSIKLHLPYCGVIQLDASDLYNRSLFVKYVVDLITGDVAALLYLDRTNSLPGIPYMVVSGHAGVDIPLTASNRQQAEIRHASQTVSAVVGAGSHILSGDVAGGAEQAFGGFVNAAGMDYTSQRSAAPSSACTTKMNRNVYIEVSRPGVDVTNSEGFKAIHGYPCHKYKNLGYFTGFVKADARTKIDIAMTGEENRMLENLLTTGIFV